MNDNMPNNNENVEEVPFDLFDQIQLDEKPVEVVDLKAPEKPKETSKNVISIPAGAYLEALRARSGSGESQNNN